MWRDIKGFTGSVAKHSGLVVGSNMLALLGFGWTVYENLHSGPGLRTLLVSYGALLLLLAAAFLSWREERYLRRRAESAFEWRKLASDFAVFSASAVTAEWARNRSTGVRTWTMPVIMNNRNAELCFELCRMAGKRLRASEYPPFNAPKLKKPEDDIDLWLDALVEILRVGDVRGETVLQNGDETTEFENGRIRNLGEASQLMCLRVAGDQISFAGGADIVS